MLNTEKLIKTVRKNCEISDSHHAGLFSICGLALRLRDLYKWEKELPPWIESDPSEVLDWIGDREDQWNTLEDFEYEALMISGKQYGPFDHQQINSIIEPNKLFYGSGYARSLKPTFFLAKIEEKTRINGYTVYTLGRELARDLLTIPALAQDKCVLLRKETAMYFLWDQMVYIKKSGRPALSYALNQCGLNGQSLKTLKNNLDTIFGHQKDTYIYHEIGEMNDTVFNHDIWREIIAEFPHTSVELLARAVKDLLADTNEKGTLQHIIKNRKVVSLGLYVAFLDGLAQELFPQLRASFKKFVKHRDWEIIEEASAIGRSTAEKYAGNIMERYREGKEKNDMDRVKKGVEDLIPKKN